MQANRVASLRRRIQQLLIRRRSSEIFCMNAARVISPFSIRSFASASVCARLDTRSSSLVTGFYPVLHLWFLIDHLIRSCQHVWWNCKSDLLGRFQIDHELKRRRSLYGQVARLRTFQDFVHIHRRTANMLERSGPYAMSPHPLQIPLVQRHSAVCALPPTPQYLFAGYAVSSHS